MNSFLVETIDSINANNLTDYFSRRNRRKELVPQISNIGRAKFTTGLKNGKLGFNSKLAERFANAFPRVLLVSNVFLEKSRDEAFALV